MKLILYTILISLLPYVCFSQTLEELKKRREKTEKEIELATSLLTQTEQERVSTVEQLSLLKNQINLRKSLIDDITKQIELKEKQIEQKSIDIQELNINLKNLKAEYAQLIQYAWKNRKDMHILMFIFASDDFNQAYRRLRFYQQFIRYREKQGREIKSTQEIIENELLGLSQSRTDLEDALASKSDEIAKLNAQENRYSKSVVQLKRKEKQLAKQLKERKKAMEALNKEIAQLIAEEAKQTKVRDARYIELSEGFSGNKGKLPWPTEQGIIVSDFGEHNHPVIKGVKIRNNGVDIRTQSKASVKAIYEGVIKKIVSIPGANIAVIIRHGDFLTVYSNLSSVSVEVEQRVDTNQKIGVAFTDPQEGKGMLNLQIWHESNIQNPKDWILP